jgi:hypothetical protein
MPDIDEPEILTAMVSSVGDLLDSIHMGRLLCSDDTAQGSSPNRCISRFPCPIVNRVDA